MHYYFGVSCILLNNDLDMYGNRSRMYRMDLSKDHLQHIRGINARLRAVSENLGFNLAWRGQVPLSKLPMIRFMIMAHARRNHLLSHFEYMYIYIYVFAYYMSCIYIYIYIHMLLDGYIYIYIHRWCA